MSGFACGSTHGCDRKTAETAGFSIDASCDNALLSWRGLGGTQTKRNDPARP